MNRLSTFLQGDRSNEWLYFEKLEVYVRKSHRYVDGKMMSQVFDVANIHVYEEHRGTGVFKEWLAGAEQLAFQAGCPAIYVESIHEKRLLSFLEKQGYALLDTKPPSMIKRAPIK